ncbi:MAG: nucleoside triphosphate pyrophosphohydrolase [Planctomycetota bacterium]
MSESPPPPNAERIRTQAERLAGIMHQLRSDCPWDREQTLQTLRAFVLEEAYEVVEALDAEDLGSLRGELGDLVFQVFFQAEIAGEQGAFDLADVFEGISDKLVRRHPHVFGDTEVQSSKDVLDRWESLKMKEGRTSRLDGVPVALPALLQAQRIQQKASSVGFDWGSPEEALPKVAEELEELAVERRREKADTARIEEEFGDLMFAMVNVARLLDLNAEHCLRAATRKFTARFRSMEQKLADRDQRPEDLPLDELEALWQEAKLNG